MTNWYTQIWCRKWKRSVPLVMKIVYLYNSQVLSVENILLHVWKISQTFDVNRPNKMDPKFKSNIGNNLLQLSVFKCVIVFQDSIPLSTLCLCVGTQTACPAASLENKHAVQTFLLHLCTRSKQPIGNWMDQVSQTFLVVISTYWGRLLLQLCRKSLYMYNNKHDIGFQKIVTYSTRVEWVGAGLTATVTSSRTIPVVNKVGNSVFYAQSTKTVISRQYFDKGMNNVQLPWTKMDHFCITVMMAQQLVSLLWPETCNPAQCSVNTHYPTNKRSGWMLNYCTASHCRLSRHSPAGWPGMKHQVTYCQCWCYDHMQSVKPVVDFHVHFGECRQQPPILT